MDETVRKQTRRSTILSRIVAGVICVLLVLLLCEIVASRDLVDSELEEMKEGPYPVSVAAGHVETLLVSLKTLTAYPDVLFSEPKAEDLRAKFAEVNQGTMSNLDVIVQHPLDGDGKQVANLQKQYRRLVTYQSLLISMIGNADASSVQIKEFIDSRINPQIDLLLQIDLEILDASTQAVETTYHNVTETIHASMIATYLFMTAVVVAVVVYLIILNGRARREAVLMEKLNAALVEAQAASEAKSAFLANVSHDLRTPMNAIIGLTSIMRAHSDDPKRVEECLGRITVSSNHLLSLIDDVLDMNKIESGRIDLVETDFSLPEMLSNLYMILEPQRRAKHQIMHMNIRNIVHENLRGDDIRLNQMLSNLTSNAIKYTPDGGRVDMMVEEVPLSVLYGLRNADLLEAGNSVTVLGEMEAAPHYDERDHVALQVTVADNGIGMSPEFLAHIFDAFERERNETTNFTQGTGLGMAITKKIVDAMGGHIRIESTLGKGSVFQATLPVGIVAADENETDGTTYDDPDRVTVAGHTVRLLLADDEAHARTNALEEAKRMGIHLEVTASGAEALAVAKAASSKGRAFDGYIIDWVMDGIDGVETARRLLDIDGVTEDMVYLAAYDPANVGDRAREIGVTNFITKPLFVSRLRAMIAELQNGPSEEAARNPEDAATKFEGRVLLVEDNEINCEIATELISDFGPEVDVARDGVEAMERMKNVDAGHYRLIFMDLQMPRMNGIEATREIIAYEKEQGIPHTPIVAMTANAFVEDRRATVEAGMDGFMAKPINLAELRENITKYFAG